MSHTSDTLSRARALLDSPESWTQGALARDATGVPVEPTSQYATCWCLTGALRVSAQTPEEELDAIVQLEGRVPQLGLESHNDHPGTRHADVLGLLDEAIALSS